MHSKTLERTEPTMSNAERLKAAEQWAKDATERANAYSDHPSDKLAVEAFTEKMMAEGHLQMVRELVEQPSEPSSPA